MTGNVGSNVDAITVQTLSEQNKRFIEFNLNPVVEPSNTITLNDTVYSVVWANYAILLNSITFRCVHELVIYLQRTG